MPWKRLVIRLLLMLACIPAAISIGPFWWGAWLKYGFLPSPGFWAARHFVKGEGFEAMGRGLYTTMAVDSAVCWVALIVIAMILTIWYDRTKSRFARVLRNGFIVVLVLIPIASTLLVAYNVRRPVRERAKIIAEYNQARPASVTQPVPSRTEDAVLILHPIGGLEPRQQGHQEDLHFGSEPSSVSYWVTYASSERDRARQGIKVTVSEYPNSAWAAFQARPDPSKYDASRTSELFHLDNILFFFDGGYETHFSWPSGNFVVRVWCDRSNNPDTPQNLILKAYLNKYPRTM